MLLSIKDSSTETCTTKDQAPTHSIVPGRDCAQFSIKQGGIVITVVDEVAASIERYEAAKEICRLLIRICRSLGNRNSLYNSPIIKDLKHRVSSIRVDVSARRFLKVRIVMQDDLVSVVLIGRCFSRSKSNSLKSCFVTVIKIPISNVESSSWLCSTSIRT